MKKRIGFKAVFVSGVLLVWAVFSPKLAKAAIGTVTEVPFGNVALGTSKTNTLVITNLDQTNSTSLRFTFSYNECTDFTVDPLSIPLVGPGKAAEVNVTFKPIILGACSADFFVYYYEHKEEPKGYRSVKVIVKGKGVEEDAGGNEPPGGGESPKDVMATVVIDGCDTGVPDQAGEMKISDRIAEECIEEPARNHGQFVSCVAQIMNALKKAGLITGSEKAAIQRCAARADIPRRRKK